MCAALGLELNSERYVELMRKLIGEVEHLQNNSPPSYLRKTGVTGNSRKLVVINLWYQICSTVSGPPLALL